jgi:hypothetical protein
LRVAGKLYSAEINIIAHRSRQNAGLTAQTKEIVFHPTQFPLGIRTKIFIGNIFLGEISIGRKTTKRRRQSAHRGQSHCHGNEAAASAITIPL